MRLLRLAATLWWTLMAFALPAAADDFRLLVLDNAFVKWGEPSLGAGAQVTYAFATKDTANEDARNCKNPFHVTLPPFRCVADAARNARNGMM